MPIFIHAIVDNIYNVLKDRETFNILLQQGLDEAYWEYKDSWVDFFMRMKDKVNIKDLVVHVPFWTPKREKGMFNML